MEIDYSFTIFNTGKKVDDTKKLLFSIHFNR